MLLLSIVLIVARVVLYEKLKIALYIIGSFLLDNNLWYRNGGKGITVLSLPCSSSQLCIVGKRR